MVLVPRVSVGRVSVISEIHFPVIRSRGFFMDTGREREKTLGGKHFQT